MDIYAKAGTKVKFIEDNVSRAQIQWGSNDDPSGLLVIGRIYEIDHTEVHTQHTEVFLKEFPGKQFNSVWFESIGETS